MEKECIRILRELRRELEELKREITSIKMLIESGGGPGPELWEIRVAAAASG